MGLSDLSPKIRVCPQNPCSQKPVFAAFYATSSSPNATIRSLGFIFIVLILRLVLRSYAEGFRLSRIG
jgi:hypothetical protein